VYVCVCVCKCVRVCACMCTSVILGKVILNYIVIVNMLRALSGLAVARSCLMQRAACCVGLQGTTSHPPSFCPQPDSSSTSRSVDTCCGRLRSERQVPSSRMSTQRFDSQASNRPSCSLTPLLCLPAVSRTHPGQFQLWATRFQTHSRAPSTPCLYTSKP